MSDFSPFPESEQKAFLRRHHLVQAIAPYRTQLGRSLCYFGLPSARMTDIDLWKRELNQITAVERDPDVALAMLRTALSLGVRDRLVVLETDLANAARLLAADEAEVMLSLSQLPPPLAAEVQQARSVRYDIVNIDLCGGFLYPDKQGESEYEKMLRHLLAFQARQKQSFILIVTFSTRDAGRNEYRRFVSETLSFLTEPSTEAEDFRHFYLSEKRIEDQPPNLRNLRFCVPVYLTKISFDNYEVRCLSQWYYKSFFHTALFFELRQGSGPLGHWPPIDEIKNLLNTPLNRVDLEEGEIKLRELATPLLK